MASKNLFIKYILLLIICIIYSEGITLKFLIFSYFDNEDSYYRLLVNGFNNYCKENGLDIDIELSLITPETSTTDIESYDTIVNSHLVNKKTEYDIFFYYSAYTKKYGEHFINLKEYLPVEYIKGFDERLLKETCSSYDNKLVGLPIYMIISALFSNQILLKKYNKNIPKTWDELITTSKYIYEEEKKLGNSIIPYLSTINESSGSMSLYEFINSFRKSNDSPHPELTSEETMEALDKLKEMKEEFGEDIFRAPDNLAVESIFFKGDALFVRYFFNPHIPIYKASALPGQTEGVSGSIVIPYNLGINKYIDEERKKAAVEFLKYVTSKEVQKEYIIKNSMISALTELYDDEEVCNVIECNVVKDAYPFSFMDNDEKLFGDDNYHIKYRDIMFDYIYNNKTLSEVTKTLDDITLTKGTDASTSNGTKGTDDSTSNGTNTKIMSGISFCLSLIFILWQLF